MTDYAPLNPVRKISIINTFASNGGDAAILFAIVRLAKLQFGDAVQVVIYDQQQELVSRYFPGWDFRSIFLHRVPEHGSKYKLRWMRLSLTLRFLLAAWAFRFKCEGLGRPLLSADEFKDLRDYATSDAIITTGGTYLVETYPLFNKLFGLAVGCVLRKPIIFYTQSLGPFHRRANRFLLRKIINKSSLVLLRDSLSFDNLKKLKVRDDHLRVSSDVVFSFAQEADIRNAAARATHKIESFKVGITVRDWPFFKKRTPAEGMDLYSRSIAAMVCHLCQKHNARIIFISTCQGIPEYHEDDSEVASKIKSTLPSQFAQAVEVNTKFHSHGELMDVYRTCDLVISTRMHGAILALSSGTPVLPISYEFKTNELFGSFGLREWVLDIETIEPVTAVALLERYLVELPFFRRKLFEHVEASRREAVKSGNLMREAVIPCLP